ncbi:MAG: GNAT family N-acetyltransferase [Spirochaetales bacterium]|nr:GNAT family N-acetyltransferase [Spirochaetales bacterium]
MTTTKRRATLPEYEHQTNGRKRYFGSELYISDLLIDQNHRGKGIGNILLKKAEELASQHGCVRLMLNNSKDSESFRRSFYKKYGFNERIYFAHFVLKNFNESKTT